MQFAGPRPLTIKSQYKFSNSQYEPRHQDGTLRGLARSANPPVLTSGQSLTVDWEETIYHPGRFEIYFSQSGDSNFTLLKTIPQDPANNSGNTPHPFATTITLPNVACTDCTLQLVQVMLENPNVPSLYYSCSDFQLKAASTTPPPTTQPASPNCPAP